MFVHKGGLHIYNTHVHSFYRIWENIQKQKNENKTC